MKLIFCLWLLYVSNSAAFKLARWTGKTTGYSLRTFDTSKPTKTSILPYRHGVSSPLHVVLDPNMVQMFQQALWANGIQAAFLSRIPKVPLTPAGLLHSAILGTGLMTFLGVEGWLVCVIYLILGSLVTKIKMKEKEQLGLAEKRGGKRGPENVWRILTRSFLNHKTTHSLTHLPTLRSLPLSHETTTTQVWGSAAAAMVCAIMTYVSPAHARAWLVATYMCCCIDSPLLNTHT